MDNIDNTFDRLRKNSPAHTLSEDFENQVFSKIKKKKIQRKATASVVLGIAIFAFIFVGQAIFSHKQPERKISIAKTQPVTKEEVPVMEDVIFASSDKQTNYAIQQVAYYEDENSI